MLASLNHPNIAAIYGLEESGGLTALLMELVEGDDLSQRIARGLAEAREQGLRVCGDPGAEPEWEVSWNIEPHPLR